MRRGLTRFYALGAHTLCAASQLNAVKELLIFVREYVTCNYTQGIRTHSEEKDLFALLALWY